MKPEFKMAFRDRLALDRTYLAKERTVLAYVRTGLAMIGVALFIYRFMEVGYFYSLVLAITLVVPGAYAVVYGIYKTVMHRKERKAFEKDLTAVGDNEA